MYIKQQRFATYWVCFNITLPPNPLKSPKFYIKINLNLDSCCSLCLWIPDHIVFPSVPVESTGSNIYLAGTRNSTLAATNRTWTSRSTSRCAARLSSTPWISLSPAWASLFSLYWYSICHLTAARRCVYSVLTGTVFIQHNPDTSN
jgi:hypothetical protein